MESRRNRRPPWELSAAPSEDTTPTGTPQSICARGGGGQTGPAGGKCEEVLGSVRAAVGAA